MNESSVPVLVIAARQDAVEYINRILRDAGHPVKCVWAKSMKQLPDLMEIQEIQLIMFVADKFRATIREIVKARQNAAQMAPLVVLSKSADEATITDAMLEGVHDLVSIGQKQRICAVAERELRSFRLERALNETLNSATQYKKQLQAFMAGSVDAIVQVQEGIVVEANQAWAELFGHGRTEQALGPLMDSFHRSSHAALKGALIACAKGQWEDDRLRVNATSSDGSKFTVELLLEDSVFDGEPAVSVSVPRKLEAPQAEPEELVERAVHVDAGTRFYQRQRFIELLTDKLDERPSEGARALAFVRIDKFREVSDDLGPVSSEEIVVHVAELIRGLLKTNDLAGRFGGTVFTIVLERGSLRDIEAWADHVVERISSHIFEVASNSVSVTCTVGLAEMGHGTDLVQELIKNAEMANQLGREAGGNRVVLEETSDESTRIKRFDALWVHQIKSALTENRFRLVHQPVVSLTGGNERIFDTVIKMIDQQGDEVAASEFMPAAKRNRLARSVDHWVIGATIDFCLREKFDLVFVKLSGDTISDVSLFKQLCSQVKEKKVSPRRICIQVAEADAMQYIKQTKALAARLRNRKFRFAIEHFGIGRDPMGVLNQIEMDFVKIDGSLMQGIADDSNMQEQVRAYTTGAKKHKIATIAERIEDANTMAVLFQLGIGYMQGHYVHEPEVVLEELA